MRILSRLFGKNRKGRHKKEEDWKGKNEKWRYEQYDIMPNFRRDFLSLPDIIKATAIEPEDTKKQNVPSVQDRTAARNVAEKEAKAVTCKEKVKDVHTRIQTAKSRNMEIVWLLQTNKDIRYKSLSDLIRGYGSVRASNSYKGMSVNYASDGELHEISPLDERDLEGLAKKLE